VRNKRRTLDHFLTVVGNIQTRNVGPQHVDTFFAAMQSKHHSPGTLNNHLFTLRHYFKWCTRRKYRSVGDDPSAGRRPFKPPERRRLMIPRQDFGKLLDAATHPRDRMVVALGLYLFLRQGEVASLRLGDVDLDEGTVHVTVHKTGQIDPMPITKQLDRELRRWFTWYSVDAGPLQPDWYLCPSKLPPKFASTGQRRLAPVVRPTGNLRPTAKMTHVEDCAKRALLAAGFPIRDAEGKSTMEGIHTLRRSGARALFDDMADNRGYDGAGRLVQAMLHHKNFTMTERYLQIDLDRKRRDDILRGQSMFTEVDTSNVVELRKGAQ
jgi:integrase